MINEPVRRWRVTGTDLLPRFAAVAPLDVFGMGVTGLAERLGLPADRVTTHDDVPQAGCTPSWPGGGPTCTCAGGPRSGSA